MEFARAPPIPQPPYSLLSSKLSLKEKLKQIQLFIESFEYNHTGTGYYSPNKLRGFLHVSNLAQEVMKKALPIQCVEATFLGAYLTCKLPGIERFPLSFTSQLEGATFRHIVLAISDGKSWGTIGISRQKCLAYKELKYPSLGALVSEFGTSYKSCWHELVAVRAGLPLPKDPSCNERIKWKVISVNWSGTNDKEADSKSALGADNNPVLQLDQYSFKSMKFLEQFRQTGSLPRDPLLNIPTTLYSGSATKRLMEHEQKRSNSLNVGTSLMLTTGRSKLRSTSFAGVVRQEFNLKDMQHKKSNIVQAKNEVSFLGV